MPYIKRTGTKTHIPELMKIIKSFLFTMYSLVLATESIPPTHAPNCYRWWLLPPLSVPIDLRKNFIPFLYLSSTKKRKRKEEEEEKFKSYFHVMTIPNLNFFFKFLLTYGMRALFLQNLQNVPCQSPFSIALIMLYLLIHSGINSFRSPFQEVSKQLCHRHISQTTRSEAIWKSHLFTPSSILSSFSPESSFTNFLCALFKFSTYFL